MRTRMKQMPVIHHVMRGLTLLLTVLCIVGCGHIYHVHYYLAEEKKPTVRFEGYQIETELQSRPTRYEGTKGLIYLSFLYGCSGDDEAGLCDESVAVLVFDSVGIDLIMSDSVVYPEPLETETVMDDYYSYGQPRNRLLYAPFKLTPGDLFVNLTYVVKLVDVQTGAVLKSRRVKQELHRNAYRDT